jgi:hypothetical protein
MNATSRFGSILSDGTAGFATGAPSIVGVAVLETIGLSAAQ